MSVSDNRFLAKADNYDQCVERSGYQVPEVLFGIMYDYIQMGAKILDIGTGTGRAARLFVKAGLEAYGMDLSAAMLEICKEKGYFTGLRQHDLTQEPYPFAAAEMDMIICTGVLNHFADLSVFFRESARILKPQGYLGIMTGYIRESELPLAERRVEHGGEGEHPQLLAHTDKEIVEYMQRNGFCLISSLVVRVCSSKHKHVDFPVRLSVMQKVMAAVEKEENL